MILLKSRRIPPLLLLQETSISSTPAPPTTPSAPICIRYLCVGRGRKGSTSCDAIEIFFFCLMNFLRKCIRVDCSIIARLSSFIFTCLINGDYSNWFNSKRGIR
ncbi:unnamed protein product [Musa acuminata subsp. burmannicoides]